MQQRMQGAIQRTMQGAIFDIDGTLLDSMSMWDHAGEWYLAGRGIAAEPGLGRILLPMSMEQAAEFMRERYRLPQTVSEIVCGVEESVSRFYREEVLPKKGAEEFLVRMRRQGFRMTAATSSSRKEVEAALSRCGLLPFFEQIFTCTEIGAGKDRPDIYEKALSCMETDRRRTWVFEDALHAAATAKKAGFLVAAVYDEASGADQEALKAISDCYIRDFNDFPAFLRIASGDGEGI